ncbi:general substrate transporter [Xylariales sp. PMI_506]|nr:general substrate transporter [Xylariales sp. PMI_506]
MAGKLLTSPKEWSLYKDMTGRAWRVAIFACLGAMVFGYDTAWWSGVLGMPAFTEQYGKYNSATSTYSIPTALTSAGSGIPTVGRILGGILTPFIADRIGRRWCMLVMCIMFIVAIIVEVTAKSFWQIVIGRFLNYIPMGMANALIPVYQAECAPPSCRGSLVTVYTWFCDVGALTASGIVFNTHTWTGEKAYKTVMGVQMAYPVLLIAALPMIPETPRWLCTKGRRDEAMAILKTLRTSEEIAELELLDIEASLEMRNTDGSWLDLFRGSNLRRTIISVVIPTIESWQGQSFMGNYLIVFLQALGVTNSYLLSLLLQAVLLIVVTLMFWTPDFVGRRPMMLAGSITMFITMYTTAGVSGMDTTHISNSRKQVAVGMLFIWAIAYACTWQTLGFMAPAEIPTTRLKAKTSGVAYFSQQSGGLIITFVSPYIQAKIGPYIGFFFGFFSFIGIIFVFFCYPEVRGASIEELDMWFDQKLPTRQFGKVKRGQHAIQEYVIEGSGGKVVEMSEETKGAETNVTSTSV